MSEVLDIQTVVSVLVKELSLLKQENEKLRKENSELRERLSRYEHPKDSHNSNLPPTKNPIGIKHKVNLREKSGRKSGGQAGHPGKCLEMQTPDNIELLIPHYCSCCGRDLSEIEGEEGERRQEIDIPPIRPIVTEYRQIRKVCGCSHVNAVEFPSTVTAPVCYGTNLQALVTYLSVCQHIPYERMTRMLNEVFGVSLSEGTVKNILSRMEERLTPAYEVIRERIAESAVAGADETGISVNGKTSWAWTLQTGLLTYITAGHSRKKEVFDGIMPEGMPETILVSDCYSSYFSANVKSHQICTSHILRELIYLSELIPSSNAYAGGVRIKKISYKDGNSEYSREYKYVKNFSLLNPPTISSGILGTVPLYNYAINVNQQPLGTLYTGYYDAYSSQPVSPLSLAEGSPVGYSEVAEVIKDKSGNSLGYTVYKYTNFDSNPDSPPVNTATIIARDYGARNKNDVERGKLLSQTDFTNNDVCVKDKSYTYKKIQKEGIRAIENRRFFLSACAMVNCIGYAATAYYFNNNSYLPDKETETVYDTSGNNPVATVTSYVYNSNNLVSESSTINSDQINYKTSYTYPTDYSATYPYNEMIGKNILNPIVQKTTYKSTSTVSVEKNNYDKFQSVFYAPLNKQIQNGNNTLETREVYAYDSKDNLRQITKDNADQVVYLWGYNYLYPIAEIKGVAYSDVTNKVAEATLNAIAAKNDLNITDSTTINSLRTLLPQALVTTYTYKPLVGMLSMTDPHGVVTKYDYDSFGRLIKVTQADKVIETYDYHYKN